MTAREKAITTFQTRNSVCGMSNLARLRRIRSSPKVVANAKTLLGYDWRSTIKLNASPAGGARIIKTVKAHFKAYGARGVPNGRVDAHTFG